VVVSMVLVLVVAVAVVSTVGIGRSCGHCGGGYGLDGSGSNVVAAVSVALMVVK